MLEDVILKTAVEVVTRASVSPAVDVISSLKYAKSVEESEAAGIQLDAILRNIELAAAEGAAVCQDTGFPNFYVKLGDGFPIRSRVFEILTRVVREVTQRLPLRPNTVDPFHERNPGDNTGVHAPWFDVELFDGDYLEFYYIPKGGGTELPSRAFTLPPGVALREMPRLVLEAVADAGPMPCPPVIVGIGIGPSIDIAAKLAKKAAVLRSVGSRHPESEIAEIEERLLKAINALGIGTHGVGGKVTALDVHIEYAYRHPAAFSLGIVFSCWATRRVGARVYPDGRSQILYV